MLTVIHAFPVEFLSLPFVVVETFMDLLIILICWNLYLAQNTCSKEGAECTSFDTYYSYCTGTVCGGSVQGYHISFFSNKCIPVSACTKKYFFPQVRALFATFWKLQGRPVPLPISSYAPAVDDKRNFTSAISEFFNLNFMIKNSEKNTAQQEINLLYTEIL